ncbi:DUF6620 family protein [Olivibacter sp. CPCC 100613]|uniref:DUF6620 family protein n=1 Tax=Olivibacter sp. CPCC 100613 TaxID=3079931 RepID=UPI002FFC238E
MFKKFLKGLTDNLEDIAKNAATTQQKADNSTNKELFDAYLQGDYQKAFDTGAASAGYSTMNTATEDPNDPQLQPVHGITIFDYAAGAAKIGEGCSEEQICLALGVERPMWDEAQVTWNNRMRDDKSFNVVSVYSKYFGMIKEHEKLGGLQPEKAPVTQVESEAAKATLHRLETDKYYFFEIQGAMQAAYDNGIDGAQWLIDELGLTVSQVNSAGTKWMGDFNIMAQMIDYQDQKKKEYSERFSSESGTGGIADDIKF